MSRNGDRELLNGLLNLNVIRDREPAGILCYRRLSGAAPKNSCVNHDTEAENKLQDKETAKCEFITERPSGLIIYREDPGVRPEPLLEDAKAGHVQSDQSFASRINYPEHSS